MVNNSLIDDILDLDFPTPSTSFHEIHSSGIEPDFVQPNELNITETLNTTTEVNQVGESLKHLILGYIGHHHWILYVILAGLAIFVIAVIALIVWFIMKHKKRVIRQRSDDQMLASTYDPGTNWLWRKCCCRESEAKREQRMRVRQNSASNMDPYKRAPLPPIVSQPIGQHYNISTFAKKNILDDDDAISDKHLAIHIQGINGVPHVPLRAEQYRKLPPLPPPSMNK